MPRIDDYKQALELTKGQLAGRSPDLIASSSNAAIHRENLKNISLVLTFLNEDILITWPEMRFSYKNSHEEIPIQHQILLLHYLYGCSSSSGGPITGEWIAFQDVPDGKFYQDAFLRRAKYPLLKGFGANPGLLVELAKKVYRAVPFDHGDFSVVVKALPLVPVALVLWEGDEEFPPEGNILFDRSISHILSAEDIAWLAGMVIYPLVGMAKEQGPRHKA